VSKPIKDLAASVRHRLQSAAISQGRPFQEILEYYAMERFLYRLGCSEHAGRFVLKGALMFRAWGGPQTRPTRDIDLLARMDNTVDNLVEVFQSVCRQTVEEDGLVFPADQVRGAVIKEEAHYPGVRVSFLALLQNARVVMQSDIGFADVVTPGPITTDYPVILEFPAPRLAGYPRETVVAEKFEAMVRLGELNSRMKDFFDILLLSRSYGFARPVLVDAVKRTFANRQTELPRVPTSLNEAFAQVPGKQAQWKGFLKKGKLDGMPEDFAEVIKELGRFLLPVAHWSNEPEPVGGSWPPGGPWLE